MSDATDELVDKLLASYTVDENGCWNWTGTVRPNGYAYLYVPGERRWLSAHRFSYEHHVGPIPDGLVTDHLCRNRKCINPEHLEPVTDRVNVLRGEGPTAENARKTHCLNGHPLDGDNLYIDSRGGRNCRACWSFKTREYNDRVKGQKVQCDRCGEYSSPSNLGRHQKSIKCQEAQ